MRYGLWDTVDRVWLGTDKGPLSYEKKDIAMFAAESIAFRLGIPLDRVKATEYTDQPLVKRDETPFTRTSEEVEAHWDRRERGLL
jgi:hypothetical protein